TEDWIIKAQRGEYPFELAETLAYAFGRSAPKSGLNTARDFLYSIREFSLGAVRPYYASTALTTAFFRLPTCIYCSSMAIPRPLASFPAVIWEEEEHSRWSWLGCRKTL